MKIHVDYPYSVHQRSKTPDTVTLDVTTARTDRLRLISIIDAGLYLSKKLEAKTVIIRIHDIRSPSRKILEKNFGLFNLKKYVISKIVRSKNLLRNGGSMRNFNPLKKMDIFERIYNSKEKVSIKHKLGALHITLCDIERNTPDKSNERVNELWNSCFRTGEFDYQEFLNLHHRGIRIGDAVASHVLREVPEWAGRLQASPQLKNLLEFGIKICDYGMDVIGVTPGASYVSVGERSYLGAVLARSLVKRGALCLERESYEAEYRIVGKDASHPMIVQKSDAPACQNWEGHVQKYLSDRVHANANRLRYMIHGANKTSGPLKSENGDDVVVGVRECYAVVFLHSFSDAQYFFGLDGFNDLRHWLKFTLDELSKNNEFERIFIKPHPNTNYGNHPVDKFALYEINREVQKNSKLIILESDSALKEVIGRGFPFCITHHGSVAEEATFLGAPVIASVYAPWSDNYKFLTCWRTPDEYRKILNDLSRQRWFTPSNRQKMELYKFVQSYRLSYSEKRHPWERYYRIMYGTWPEDDVKDLPKITMKMSGYYSESKALRRLIDQRIEEIQ